MKAFNMVKPENKNSYYKLLCAILAMILVIMLVILLQKQPDIFQNSKQTDFSSSDWLDRYIQQESELYGMDFIQSSGFSVQPAGGKFVILYASSKSVKDVRDYYIKFRGAEETGRNDETALNLEMDSDAGNTKLINYYSGVCQVYEMTLYPEDQTVSALSQRLEESFPEQELKKALKETELAGGEVYGQYIRYQYDDLDSFFKKNIPIYGRAYYYEKDAAAFDAELQQLKRIHPKNRFDQDQQATYFKLEDSVIGLSLQQAQDGSSMVSVSIQQLI